MDSIARARFPGFKTISDAPFQRRGVEAHGRVARKESAQVPASTRRFDRKIAVLPPIERDVEPACLNGEIQVSEAVMSRDPAVDEMGSGAPAAQPFHQQLSVG